MQSTFFSLSFLFSSIGERKERKKGRTSERKEGREKERQKENLTRERGNHGRMIDKKKIRVQACPQLKTRSK